MVKVGINCKMSKGGFLSDKGVLYLYGGGGSAIDTFLKTHQLVY
jgi:hypothetical protein